MQALFNGRIFTGERWLDGHAVLIEGGRFAGVVPVRDAPREARRVDLEEGLLAPGFVDLQVNGGGGVMLNDEPSVEAIRAIGEAHRRFGTTGLLPTLITADRPTTARALEAVREAILRGAAPGTLGLHLEGPHLAPERPGVHDASLMRPIRSDDIDLYTSLGVGRTYVTLAPEMAPPDAIRALAGEGVVVAAGHTDAGPDLLLPAIEAGLAGFTHLFNAMSPFSSRAPGAVGTALASERVWCSLILDGHHVDPLAAKVVLAAKPRGRVLLVTDAMPPAAGAPDAFRLGDQEIRVAAGRCTTPDGRLAGSVLDMAGAVRNAVAWLGIGLDEALRMASTYPAATIGLAHEIGRIAKGFRADLVLLDGDLGVRATWIGGDRADAR